MSLSKRATKGVIREGISKVGVPWIKKAVRRVRRRRHAGSAGVPSSSRP